jgi:hypothetical protein
MAVSSIEPNIPDADNSAGLVTRLALRFGGAAGLACVIWMVGLQLTGNNGFGPKQILAQLLVPMAALASEWVLRRQLKPAKPGLSRSLVVGLLTALIAAVISAVGVLGLALGAGEAALARNRAEVKEIVRVQQRENPKVMRSEKEIRQQLQNVDNLTVKDLAASNFALVLLLGLVLGLPGGIFFRE